MDNTELLTAIAEISVAFAGFGGLIAIFVGRRPGALSLDDYPQFWFVIELSLLNLFAALLPLILFQIFAERPWAWSSLAFAFLAAGYGVRVISERRATPAEDRLPIPYVSVIYGVGATIVALLLANASGWWWETSAWPYLVMLIWVLAGIAANYLRFLRILAASG
jgi:hypothetical protein